MIKKVLVTLLVTVDTEDEEICPTGDPLAENVVINVLDDGFFSDPLISNSERIFIWGFPLLRATTTAPYFACIPVRLLRPKLYAPS